MPVFNPDDYAPRRIEEFDPDEYGATKPGDLKPERFTMKRFGREAAGAVAGVADIGMGALSMPFAGYAGLATLFFGGAEKARDVAHRVQERSSPSYLLKQLGVPDEYLQGADPKEMLGGINARQMLEKIVMAPHEYVSVPISNKYFELTGKALPAAILQGQLDIPAYIGAVKGSQAALGRTVKGRPVEDLRAEKGYTPEEIKPVDTTRYNQTKIDLGFRESGSLELPPDAEMAFPTREGGYFGGGKSTGGGILDPKLRERLEAELNPPVENRGLAPEPDLRSLSQQLAEGERRGSPRYGPVEGQGELFTGERPYPEAFPGEGRVEAPVPSARGRAVAPREDILDIPDVTNQRIRPTDEFAPRTETPQSRFLDDASRYARGPEEGLVPRRERSFDPAFEGLVEPREAFKGRQAAPEDLGRRGPGGEIPFEARSDRPISDVIRERRSAEADAFRVAEAAAQARKDSLPWTGPGNKQRGAFGNWDWSKEENPVKRAEGAFRSLVTELHALERSLKSVQAGRMPPGWAQVAKEHGESPLKIQQRIKESIAVTKDHIKVIREHVRYEKEQASKRKVLPWTSLGSLKGPGKREAGFIGFGKSADRKGIVEAVKEWKHLWTTDRRPIAEVMKETFPNLKPEDVKDIAPEGSKLSARLQQWLAKGKANALIDRQLAILTQGKGPISTIIKWTVDHQSDINRQLKVQKEENIKVAFAAWEKLEKSNPKELEGVLQIWHDASIARKELTEADFKSSRQWEVYKAIQDQKTARLEVVNEERLTADPTGKILKPLATRESHFPFIREGDYWIYIHDSAGTLKWARGYSNIHQARLAHRALKKEFPDMEVKEPQTKKLTEHDLSSLDAFEETLNALHRDDPIAKAIQERYEYLLSKRGFGRHGIHSKGIGGFIGSEGGKKGVKESRRALEMYFNRLETHIANLKRNELARQIDALSEHKYWKDSEGRLQTRATLFENAPIAKSYINNYLDRAVGGNIGKKMEGLTELADNVTALTGFSKGAVPRFIQNTSSVAALFYLATVRNITVQFSQSVNAMSKLVEWHQTQGKGPVLAIANAAHSLFDGWVEAFKSSKLGEKAGLSADKVSQEVKRWAVKEGRLESAIVDLIEDRIVNWKADKQKIIGNLARYSLGKIEQHAVRTPVLLAFEKALRKEVPDKMERFEMAANLTDNYMVHYDRESGPMMYDKMGTIVGESTRGLKTYAHNTWGQFFEYAALVKDKKQLTPLATFLGVQALVGGLRGLILMQEAAAVIALINAYWDTDIPSPTKVMLDKGLPDMLVFGGLSTIMNKDVSASVAAPNMPQFFSAIPLEFSWRIAKESVNFLHKLINGTLTDADELRFLLASSPSQIGKWIEGYYAKDYKNIPNPHDDMRGNFPTPKDSVDFFERFGLGFKSIPEAKMNLVVREAKQLAGMRMSRRFDAIDAMVDSLHAGHAPSKEMLQKYLKEGGDLKNLNRTLQKRMTEQNMSYEQRTTRGNMTPEKFKKLEDMRKMMDDDLREQLREKRGSLADPKIKLAQYNDQAVDPRLWEGDQPKVTPKLPGGILPGHITKLRPDKRGVREKGLRFIPPSHEEEARRRALSNEDRWDRERHYLVGENI